MAVLDFIGGNPGNYVLGRGQVLTKFDLNPTNQGWRDWGNASQVSFEQESEKKEHTSFLSGIKTVDLEVAISTKITLSMTFDEVGNLLNQAPWWGADILGVGFGTPAVDSFGSGAPFNPAMVASNDVTTWIPSGPFSNSTKNFLIAAADVQLGFWYDISVVTEFIPIAWRAYGFEPGQTFLVERGPTGRGEGTGTVIPANHYEIDRKLGRIRFNSFPVAPPFNILVSWSAPSNPPALIGADIAGQDQRMAILRILKNSGITCAVKFIQINPAKSDDVIEYEFFKVKLTPEGTLDGISEDWSTITFTGVASTIENPPLNASPYGRITTLSSWPTY